MPVQQRTLLEFRCSCGYTEAIGVDPQCGVIITGQVTVICPRCFNMLCINGHPIIVAVKPIGQAPQQ